MVFNKVEYATFSEAAELTDTTRGADGFGSTGKHQFAVKSVPEDRRFSL